MTIDERISAALRSHAPEVDEAAAWERIRSAATAPTRRVSRLVPIAIGAVGVALVGVVLYATLGSGSAPVADTAGPFQGAWVQTGTGASAVSMAILVTDDGTIEMTTHAAVAAECSGTPSTMTGTGQIVDGTLVFPTPLLTCDDGSDARDPGGASLEDRFRDLTFIHDDGTDTLTDSLGATWARPGAVDPIPTPTEGAMWPQATLEEIQAAQERADAGDTGATWQVEPNLADNLLVGAYPAEPEIFGRYLGDVLGWQDYVQMNGVRFGLLESGRETINLTFARCVPGAADPVYPSDPRDGGCVPTMDGEYEAVEIAVAQPGREGDTGIWVVTSAQTVAPIERVVPLGDAEAAAIFDGFLQARIDGAGAEEYLVGPGGRVRLLYATTDGAAYDRYEFSSVDRAEWPNGLHRFATTIVAGDGTVVEQDFLLTHEATGTWALEPDSDTIENGTLLPRLYEILGGQVTVTADDRWDTSLFGPMFEIDGEAADLGLRFQDLGRLDLLADPVTISADCVEGLVPVDAAALAESITSNPDFETTAPAETTVGGAHAWVLDVTRTAGGADCDGSGRWAVARNVVPAGDHMRLYLIDLPGGSARILSIAIVASEDDFESVVEAATPILDSIEFFGG
jgi:hypothetical protein